jgi:hypothetical protein
MPAPCSNQISLTANPCRYAYQITGFGQFA